MYPKSLSARLTLLMIVWTTAALLVTGIAISAYFKLQAESDFRQLLLAHTYNLIGAIEVEPDGSLRGSPDLGDPRFLRPGSGWYWAIVSANAPETTILNSPSIGGSTLERLPESELAFDDTFRRAYSFVDGNGNAVQRLESQLFFGDGGTLHQIVMSGNQRDLDAAVSEFARMIALFLSLFGAMTMIALYVLIRVALRPLKEASEALENIRRGRAETMTGNFPSEIEPLVNATNRLILSNRKIIDRSRAQVGNLAHALKTPLTVILNEMAPLKDAASQAVTRQARNMQESVQGYLARARIAAQREIVSGNTPVATADERLGRTMRKLFPDIDFEVNTVPDAAIFRGEKQDYEEIIGNLLENAARFAKRHVRLSSSLDTGRDLPLQVVVEDDGKGIAEADLSKVTQRGIRLDENAGGSGLGLSIVRDIVEDYGGELQLEASGLGGLKATVQLPGDMLDDA